MLLMVGKSKEVSMTLFAMLAFAGVLGFLFLGIASMAQGGEYDDAHVLPYMTGRVVMQAIAFLMIMLSLLATLE
jgi:hypothetical protein